jgi:hypothetical protein
MNETPDPLESELAGLQPNDVSPELRQRIIARMEPSPFEDFHWNKWGITLAGGVAVACLVWFLFHPSGRPGEERQAVAVLKPRMPQPKITYDPVEALPTLQSYRRLIARSVDDGDALLDDLDDLFAKRDSGASGVSAQATVRLFDRSNRDFEKLAGEP